MNKEAGIFNDKEYRKGNDSSIEDFDRKDLEGFNLFLDQLILSGPEIGVGGHFGVRSRHWTRYYDICHFCAIDYDVIAKVENVDIESSYIVRRAGESKLVWASGPLIPDLGSRLNSIFRSFWQSSLSSTRKIDQSWHIQALLLFSEWRKTETNIQYFCCWLWNVWILISICLILFISSLFKLK